jgi:hypothetical protein
MNMNRVLKLIGAFLLLAISITSPAADLPTNAITLDQGFHNLYNLDFDHAHQVFVAWQQSNPDNPLGPTSEAAGLLFSEFNRLGILEAQFYADDKAFDARKKLTADPALRDRFNSALDTAEAKAQARLAKNPKDRDALFAMTLVSGLRADYAALVEKRNLASLHYTKTSTGWAQQLLTVDPNCYDAHLATGISQYIIGSMTAPVRWLMRLGGMSADKQAGIAELKLTAQRGRYLAPFARILLAIAYVREKDKPGATEELRSLSQDFPNNPLFTREIARLNSAQ